MLRKNSLPHPVSLNDAPSDPVGGDGCGFIVARAVVMAAALVLLAWRMGR